MKFVNKVELNSVQEGQGSRRGNVKIVNLLQIMSKLASIKGYNDNGNILGSNGEYIQNTDIASLLIHSMSPGKILNGEQEFIQLLKKADISPYLIINETIRAKLMSQNLSKEYKEDLNSKETYLSSNNDFNIDENLSELISNENIEKDQLDSKNETNMQSENVIDVPVVTRGRPKKRKTEVEIIDSNDFENKKNLLIYLLNRSFQKEEDLKKEN
ncbi:MAG: hypothetical protein QM535_20110 [Limnohabitans sp.]|nr:hypothetical protein [Limnohabitans sp.]